MADFMSYRKQAALAARQLYGKEVAKAVRKAKTESEVCRILITARHAMED